ncbi:MAG TPA: redoxin family protein [Bryobacteraceae bacterium]|nr:redoxin family protein [Bryobacteraceae bacterium]
MWKYFLLSFFAISLWGADTHPILALGSPAPNFSLPGVDGKTHQLSDYASAKVLAVVFTCNHCPIAQMYETRIKQLASDYRGKDVAVVAIQPNDPSAIRVDELDSSDMSDSLAEMKLRAAYKHLDYPYLYDGETQAVADAYGPQATPHVFVFDAARKLRYEGRMDNSYRQELVRTRDARNAIDAILAGKPVPVTHTGVFGCSTKWKYKQQSRLDQLNKFDAEPVSVEMADAASLKKLRSNPTDKLLLVNFWATWCGPCVVELPDLVTTDRMYRQRDFEFVAVSVNMPDEKNGVLKMLQKQHASNHNLLFGSDDTDVLQKAFDPSWDSPVPFTVLIAPGGKILFRQEGELDILKLRRTILANMPSDYPGFNNYWKTN